MRIFLATHVHGWHDKESGCVVNPAYAHLLCRISCDIAYQALSRFSACNIESWVGPGDEAMIHDIVGSGTQNYSSRTGA